MYHDQYHPRVKHDVKKLHAHLQEAIQAQHIPKTWPILNKENRSLVI